MVHSKKPIIRANDCVTCKYKVKILGGAPASGAPMVPTPLYRCICQATFLILLQFSTKTANYISFSYTDIEASNSVAYSCYQS